MSRLTSTALGRGLIGLLVIGVSGCTTPPLAIQCAACARPAQATASDTRKVDRAEAEALREAETMIKGHLGYAPDAYSFTVDEVVASPTDVDLFYFRATRHMTSIAGEARGTERITGLLNRRTGTIIRSDRP